MKSVVLSVRVPTEIAKRLKKDGFTLKQLLEKYLDENYRIEKIDKTKIVRRKK